MEQICGCLYVNFETILGFTRNEQIKFSDASGGNTNIAKHLRNVTSHIGFLRNQAQRSPKMSQKWLKLKVIIYAFGVPQGMSYGCHVMPPRDMGGHYKGVMWLGTNMWMPLRSFRGKFGVSREMSKWGV